jgi:serine protease inhibitor
MRTDADADFNALSEEQLLDVATALESTYASSSKSYEGVRVPMIDLDIEVNQSWIRGIQNEDWFVAECLQQFILKLNEKGATAKSAAVMLIKRAVMMSHTPVLTFDKPFLLWFSRDGLTYPAFLAVCAENCWDEPVDLD